MVVRRLDHDGVLDHVLDLQDAALDERLLGAGVLVLRRVLGADELLGVVDLLGDLRAADCLQLFELFVELVEAFFGKGYLLAWHGDSLLAGRPRMGRQ